MDNGWPACGSDWKRPCPGGPRKHFGPPGCKNVHTAADWKQNRREREDCEWAGASSAPGTESQSLRFEMTAEIAIQSNPQQRFGGLGIAAAGVDRVGMGSRESNPPRKSHYN